MDKLPDSYWYKQAFRLDYLQVYTHRNDEEARKQVDFLTQNLGCKPPIDVLDLGCGDGRHALELARRNFHVTGLDLSEELLTRARERAAAAGLAIHFHQGDMRDIPFESTFDLVVNFFTSFGYFDSDAENTGVLLAVARALKPGGRFLMDYLNRFSVIHSLKPHDLKEENGRRIEQHRWLSGSPDVPGEPVRINKRVTIEDEQGKREYEESVQMYTPEELTSMLMDAGIEIERTFGDFNGNRFGDEAPRLIVWGCKR